MRSDVVPQAVAITALIGAGTLGIVANRWVGFQSDVAYLPPAAGFIIGVLALAAHFRRKRPNAIVGNSTPWTKPGLAIFYVSLAIFACGVALIVDAFGRRPTAPIHEGILGVWVSTLGGGSLLLGRFVGRGSI